MKNTPLAPFEKEGSVGGGLPPIPLANRQQAGSHKLNDPRLQAEAVTVRVSGSGLQCCIKVGAEALPGYQNAIMQARPQRRSPAPIAF